ncbi:hypothetical protein OTU49_017305 [Cherax quadricarinatus]|uniref:RING-type domain-containing protein n=2 Tax=Cherax quadricarinatus TaxID=27406 RepID=A0AAW0XNQ8_CHEQU|nr:E3 ubiquitin-protein ligase TRIM13-like isoform X2 [Cherax quadricarinatus]XP_053633571.1 E3 ubiquitin-protein ligase TRIM13-like isoform X2 [Cherax quadricarinatus]XP_053633573.1 E3 ubiquitin-protein ligase TRIM13-like isoform X2 [Cherax quadricarinatus]XP_053633574.1 E3 ubiquitin-protein ligase TRIM13-like isoform X2 [Cherax quadricarinatus]
MDDYKPEECHICNNNFDEGQRPRCLPCGHTICSQCIDNAIKKDKLTCPSCQANHKATNVTDFPINYGMEALINKQKSIEMSPAVSTKRRQDYPQSISKKVRCLLQEEKTSIGSLISGCEEVLTDLGDYRGQLSTWKTRHHQLNDKLAGLVAQNKAAIELLEKEDDSVVSMMTEGEKGKQQLQAKLESLDIADTAQEVIMSIDEADQCNVEVENWLQKCQEVFPDVTTVHTSVKVQETIKKALTMMTTEAGAPAAPIHLQDLDSKIMEKVDEITVNCAEELHVEHLRRMSEPIKRLVEAGRVFAVHQDKDDILSSKITLQDGQLCLHTLLRQPPPVHARTVQHGDIVGILDPSSTLAFLDLGWEKSTRGRVQIRLSPDTRLARQFVLLCTGQRGPTYHNTKLIHVGLRGQPGECVVGGDYERNDGSGGAPLLPDLRGEYRRSGSAGAVFFWYKPGSVRSAKFSIITRDCKEGATVPNVFGEVESGLDVARAAANHTDITEVAVVDCGIILPL